MHRKHAWLRIFLVTAVAVALCAFWSAQITDSPIDKDAGENLQTALNLDHEGVISDDEEKELDPARVGNTPTMDREPLPAVTGLVALRLIDAILGPSERAQYFTGQRARLLKFQNAVWMAVVTVAVYLICRQLDMSFYWSLAGGALSNLWLLSSEYRAYMLDSLTTESAAAALLVLGSFLLMRAVSAKTLRSAIYAGLCFGLLALVKAAALYVVAGIVVLLPVVALLIRRPVGQAVVRAVVVALATAVVVLPWLIRNEHSIGYFGLAGRGGEVSHNRAVMDLMSADEMLGTIYVWAPYPFNGPLRRLLGFSKTDLEAGGRLQRLNDGGSTSFAASDYRAERDGRPEDTINFYHRGRAEMFALINQFRAAGNPQPYMASDAALKHRTVQIVLHHPLRHAALTLLSIWRGAWFAFPLLAIALYWALRRQLQGVATLALPAFLLVLFYAVGSYFEPRYSMPTYPILICLAMFAAHSVASRRSA